MQMIQPNSLISSNNLQNDGIETIQSPSSPHSPMEGFEVSSAPTSIDGYIHIIGISVGALTLAFFISISSFLICKKMQSKSRLLRRKNLNSIEMQSHRREAWSVDGASPVHEMLLEKPILDTIPRSSPPLSVIELPATSASFSTATVKNVPVFVSVAVLSPPSSTSELSPEYVVISDGLPVNTTKYDLKVLRDGATIIEER